MANNVSAEQFISEYAALLLRSGATCARLEKNVQRIATAWGFNIEMAIMPRHIHITINYIDGHSSTLIKGLEKTHISFDIVTKLSKLSWEIADNNKDIPFAVKSLKEIEKTKPANRWWVLIAASLANASFCRLFGGDLTAMATVFSATMAGYFLKHVLVARKIDIRIIFIACAFVSLILATADNLFSLGKTSEIAIATSVLYLVPGIPFINAFSDLIDGHYICFFSRMTDAIILTACLSMGLCLGMIVMRLGMF